MKRSDYLSWDDYFMSIAMLSACRSKDPSTRHGAVCINPDTNRIISIGYSGMPQGNDDDFSWEREGKLNKYCFVIHAEENCILNTTRSLQDSTMYLFSEKNYLPCSNCMRLIIQSGITDLVLCGLPDKDTDVYSWDATNYMIEKCGIRIRLIKKPEIVKI